MTPFNLEAALRGEKMVAGDGEKIVQVAHFPTANPNNRIVVQSESGFIRVYSEDGKHPVYGEFSLFMAPNKKYKLVAEKVFDTKVDAEEHQHAYIPCSMACRIEEVE